MLKDRLYLHHFPAIFVPPPTAAWIARQSSAQPQYHAPSWKRPKLRGNFRESLFSDSLSIREAVARSTSFPDGSIVSSYFLSVVGWHFCSRNSHEAPFAFGLLELPTDTYSLLVSVFLTQQFF
jgi:hypothetical protein